MHKGYHFTVNTQKDLANVKNMYKNNKNFFKNYEKNILITGGFGLLGSNLYKFLDLKGNNVFILDKKKF